MEIHIPLARLTVHASRSGGPGGQNVNKVSSRVEVRFHLESADWIPIAARERLRRLFPGRITRSGEFRVVSSRFRDQPRNLKDCLQRIEGFLRSALERPRPRVATAPTAASRRERLEAKRRRSRIKRERRGQAEGE